MEQLNNTPSEPLREPSESSGVGAPQTADQALKTVTHDLKRLHQDLIVQLAQDISRLQAEKSQLIEDIERLRSHHQELQSQSFDTLAQQQLSQQQIWAKQLAQAIADHLQTILMQRMQQMTGNSRPLNSAGNQHLAAANPNASQSAYQLLSELDTTFSNTFRSIQQELNSYQSSLSQQLSRMHSLDQQGEAILGALVQRLQAALQAEAENARLLAPSDSSVSPTFYQSTSPQREVIAPTSTATGEPAGTKMVPPPSAQGAQEPPTVSSPVPPPTKQSSQVQVGLLLVLLSSVALSFHNVVVKVLFKQHLVLGLGTLGGVITPGLGNSLLILWMRMLIVIPLLAAIAGGLYPPMWQDIKRFLLASNRRPLWTVVGSGGFLFLSQVLIYLALAQISAGTAITIFFIYPTITVLLAWKIFGDRPTLFRLLVMLVICMGGVLAIPQAAGGPAGNAVLGSSAAAGSGIAFAGYVILTGLCTRKLNPVPVSLIQFSTIFVLSSIVLMFPMQVLSVNIAPEKWPGFIIGCLVLGAATLLGYLCTNIGIRLIGAAPASIVSATGPAFTAVLAFLIIQDQLQSRQWVGVILVTLGVAGLNFERMRGQILKPKAS